MTKKADKGSCAVICGRNDYIKKAEKQLNDTNTNKNVCFNDKRLQELVGTSNNFSKILKLKGKLVTINLNILHVNIKSY